MDFLTDPVTIPFVELKAKSNHSFLEGASTPEEMVERASQLGYPAFGLCDRSGVYGLPRAYRATQEHPLRLIVGAELILNSGPPLTLWAQTRSAYGLLCRLITQSHQGHEKGSAQLTFDQLCRLTTEFDSAGKELFLMTPARKQKTEMNILKDLFGDRVFLQISRHLTGIQEKNEALIGEQHKTWGFSLLATNDVLYHVRPRGQLQDLLASIRQNTRLNEDGRILHANRERYLKSPAQMNHLFRDLPQALRASAEIAEACTFHPSELRYRYPSEWIPAGHTAQSYLRQLTYEGAQQRYPGGTPDEVVQQLEKELSLIEQLQFADYFLTIWEIVDFARSRGILCQGRGSAANSAVCFCLGITAVDPVRMNLLFERFISVERGEPPDIDVDFEHERREEVIQHIYEKYGRDRAGMVAAKVTYRTRSILRDVGKAMGWEPAEAQTQALAFKESLYGFPRHLSIHSGGFTLSADPLIETVPIEPARMEGRTIVQWDKDDLDIMGLLKVDILALGMLTAIRKCLQMTGHELHQIPAEDSATYEMIRRADTIGVFQIESRAQMNMLGRLQPQTFYDLVIEVAIVRPGPISGRMVHPYLRRRRGLEPVIYYHPKLRSILGKTLGVPLFQEQVMKMAIELAHFTPGEADRLRRAIGAWRSSGSIELMGRKLMTGLMKSGLPQHFVERIFDQIKGFAEYGFPESHAASFALLAYVSSYQKRHFPAQFCCALINSQPMGFYSVHTLVEDAKRHGVNVLPVDPKVSEWDCQMEGEQLRLGFRIVKGLHREECVRLVNERERQPFTDLWDFIRRTRIRQDVLVRLALGDAFRSFHMEPRQALWSLLALRMLVDAPKERQLNLFDLLETPRESRSFDGLNLYDEVREEYKTFGLSLKAHPMQVLRDRLALRGLLKSAEAKQRAHGSRVVVAGLMIVRQMPPTAKGVVFATLEDEEGFIDLVIRHETRQKHPRLLEEQGFVRAVGVLQKDGFSYSVLVDRLTPLLSFEAENIQPMPQVRDRAWC